MNSELFDVINGVKINYRYQKRKYDHKHCIVVFSGFGGDRGITYDFEKVLEHCPSHIIWIQDSFKESCSYYWCVDMDFSYEDAISLFINNKIHELGLKSENCTFIGFSKGGTAALYYGIKHNISNIIATVPQFYVGTYIKENWKRIAHHMMGDINDDNINLLDSKLIDIIDNDTQNNKNIYLFSSEADVQYPTEIKPNIDKFKKYNNFNLFMAKSLLVSEHKYVTQYHVPLLLGILYSISQGATPYYGKCDLVADNRKAKIPENPMPVTVLKKFRFSSYLFFPEGLAYMKGVPCKKYGDIQTKLILKNEKYEIAFPLAKDHKPRLTKELYEDAYVNYDKAWFCTLKYSGMDLSSILENKGIYQLFINIQTKFYSATSELIVNKKLHDLLLEETELFRLFSKGKFVYIEIK